MEVLVNDLGTASFTYTAPQNTVSLVYSVYDNTNDEYIQYEELTFTDVADICTITIATPAVITQTAHGYVLGDAIKFSTTGALPTGLNTIVPINDASNLNGDIGRYGKAFNFTTSNTLNFPYLLSSLVLSSGTSIGISNIKLTKY